MDNIYYINYKHLKISNKPTTTNKQKIYLKNILYNYVNKIFWDKIKFFSKENNFLIAFINPDDEYYYVNSKELLLNINAKKYNDTIDKYENIDRIRLDNITKNEIFYSGNINGDDLYKLYDLNNSQCRQFISNNLSDILSNQLKNIFENKFIYVDNLFKYNFNINKINFPNYDIPIHDMQHNLYSKYTMIIFLKKCDNFVINGQNISINKNEFIIFNKKYEYLYDNNNVFIKCNLIYKMINYEFEKIMMNYYSKLFYYIKDKDVIKYNIPKIMDNVIDDNYYIGQFMNTIFIKNNNKYFFSTRIDIIKIISIIMMDNLKKINNNYVLFDEINNNENNNENISNYLDTEQRKINLKIIRNNNNIIKETKITDEFSINYKNYINYKDDSITKNDAEYICNYKNCVDDLNYKIKNFNVITYDNFTNININSIINDENNKKIIMHTNKNDNVEKYNNSINFNHDKYNKKLIDCYIFPNIEYEKKLKMFIISTDVFNKYLYKTKQYIYEPCDDTDIINNNDNNEIICDKKEILEKYFKNVLKNKHSYFIELIDNLTITIYDDIFTIDFNNIFEIDYNIITYEDNVIVKIKLIISNDEIYDDIDDDINCDIYKNTNFVNSMDDINYDELKEIYDKYLYDKIDNFDKFIYFIGDIFLEHITIDKILIDNFLEL
jgi:hypothetical protein